MRDNLREPTYAERQSASLPGVLGHADDAPAGDATALRTMPDLRGLPVEDASGIHVGALAGALTEADTGLVRYLDLALDTLERHVLIPIGHARVRDVLADGPHIRLRAALIEQLEQIPPFPADVRHVDDPYERALLEAFGRTFHGERYYAHPAYDHSGIYAGEHPIVSDAPPAPGEATLAPLSQLGGWKIARGEADIRGWNVLLGGDGTSAVITDLIVDPAAENVRYVVVELPAEGLRLLPIGFLVIDSDATTVHASGLKKDDVLSLPRYDGGPVSRESEEITAARLRDRLSGERRYHLPDFRADGYGR